jgi:HD-GYP domain-containing protein (c-di-GMP phosphodiesterase class II)
MYLAKRAGGNNVSTSEAFSGEEASAVQRQLISAYIEGFLQREHNKPEDLEELVSTFRKLCGRDEATDRGVLRESIEALGRSAELREVNADGHGEKTAHYAGVIGRSLNLQPQQVDDLMFAARIHDVGKLFVSERILNKSGPFTDDELSAIRDHARLGADALRAIPSSDHIVHAIESHHEAFDGSGYPRGLRGEDIPLWGRIIAVADAFVNMTSDRSFALAKSPEQAINELESMSGTRYDGMVVRLLARQLKGSRTTHGA